MTIKHKLIWLRLRMQEKRFIILQTLIGNIPNKKLRNLIGNWFAQYYKLP